MDTYVMPKFNRVSSDGTELVSERSFKGRVTEKRMGIIQRWAEREYFWGASCGHQHDCCGCHCGRDIKMIVTPRKIKLIVTDSYNY